MGEEALKVLKAHALLYVDCSASSTATARVITEYGWGSKLSDCLSPLRHFDYTACWYMPAVLVLRKDYVSSYGNLPREKLIQKSTWRMGALQVSHICRHFSSF